MHGKGIVLSLHVLTIPQEKNHRKSYHRRVLMATIGHERTYVDYCSQFPIF